MTISAIASLYLLSVLGVEGDERSIVSIVGAIGLLSILFAVLINGIMLIRTRNKHRSRGETETNKQRSVRGISAGQLEEGMFIGAVV